MVKHTPRPWKIDEQYVRGRKDSDVICQWGNYTDEVDARLIAAAPDMLEALQRIMAAYETSHSAKTRADAWTQVRAAIAKAEGT